MGWKFWNLRTIVIERNHVLVSVHILITVMSRCVIVFIVLIVAVVRRLRSTILLTSGLRLAGSTLQLVKPSEDALVHDSRPFHMPGIVIEAIDSIQRDCVL
jgi:hypothetical protein